ncbi:hypothetical protein PsYK624_155940 [Phanerochaete sordida]|uniref:F-box domain-containing protein n=1 Tax=Phanerochaete sordida TaxID=48140 RepID=A0A9P3LLF3_9APHY|nr:hypothetical protein PsYK624_155940 [Phanerochaete sordida]
MIFLYTASAHFFDCYGGWTSGKGASKPYQWMSIIFVCKHWHLVAFATRQLWGHVDLKKLERTRILLRLSGSTPLTVLHGSSRFSPEALMQCLTEIGRIRHFQLCMHYPIQYLKEDWLSIPLHAAPQDLRTLEIWLPLPEFTRLFLTPSLTHLRCHVMTPQLSIKEAIAILSSLPRLVELELVDCLNCYPSFQAYDQVYDGQKAALPVLEHLTLEDNDAAGVPCALLLQSLLIPATTNISITLGSRTGPSRDPNDLAEVFRRISNSLYHSGASPRSCRIHKKRRRPGRHTGLQINLWPVVFDVDELSARSEAAEPAGKLSFVLDYTPLWTDHAALDAFLASFPVSDIYVFEGHLSSFLPDVWQRFATLCNVTHVKASPHPLAHALVEALGIQPPSSTAHDVASSASLLFPKLQVLTLDEIRWDEERRSPCSDATISARCRSMLQTRLARGAPLHSVTVRDLEGFTEFDLLQLRDSWLDETIDWRS